MVYITEEAETLKLDFTRLVCSLSLAAAGGGQKHRSTKSQIGLDWTRPGLRARHTTVKQRKLKSQDGFHYRPDMAWSA